MISDELHVGIVTSFHLGVRGGFGFARRNNGEEIHFFFENGSFIDRGVKAPYFSKSTRNGSRNLSTPKIGDQIVFRISENQNGSTAKPWGYKFHWDVAEQAILGG